MNMLYDFSSALLQARQRKGVTQEQIAFSLDISQATYNAWECGHRLCPYRHKQSLSANNVAERFSFLGAKGSDPFAPFFVYFICVYLTILSPLASYLSPLSSILLAGFKYSTCGR